MILVTGVLTCLSAPGSISAQWSSNPASNNVIVVRLASKQTTPVVLRDGSSGALIVWVDDRNGGPNLYGQNLVASGTLAWENDGNVLVAAANGQECPAITPLGGDFVLAWRDRRNNPSENNILAQRFNRAGNAIWPTPAVAHQANNFAPAVFTNQNSEILTTSFSSALFDDVISAQILSADGSVRFSPQKILNPNAKGRQQNLAPPAISGIDGGLIAAWVDARNDTSLYYNGISNQGVIWPIGEQVLSNSVAGNTQPVAFSDGNSGAVIAWLDAGGQSDLLLAARINAAGAPVWARTLPASSGKKRNLHAAEVGSGNGYLVWENDDGTGPHIFLQRLGASGESWASDVGLAATRGPQTNPAITTNGSRDALVAWQDRRTSSIDIYAQAVDEAGAVKWDLTGQAVTTASGSQVAPVITDDGLDGAIVVWEDGRNGDSDIYAQRISKTGTPGEFRTIAIMSPMVGNEWEIGSRQSIAWTASPEIDSVQVEISLDQGQQYLTLFNAVSNTNPGGNRLTFTVPGPASSQARIRLTALQATFILAESGTFAVLPAEGPLLDPTVLIEAPLQNSIEILTSASDKSGVQSVTLNYRKGGADRFTTAPMSPVEGPVYRGVIPTEAVTERGLEYFVSSLDSLGIAGSSDTISVTTIFSAETETVPLTAGFAQSAYRMIGAPNRLQEPLADIVFENSGYGAYDTTSWRLFKYDNGMNVERDSSNLTTFRFSPGHAYWVIASRSRTLDFGPGRSLKPDEAFRLTLKPGWNQVSNPFAFAVAWEEVLLASNNPLVSRPSAFRDAYVQPTILLPYEGYFIFSFEDRNVDLTWPPVEAAEPPQLSKKSPGAGWQIQVTARCANARDEMNFLGIAQEAHREWDKLDQPNPPPIGENISVFFPHEDWPRHPNNYSSDFRPPAGDRQEWLLTVETNISGASVNLEFTGLSSLPANMTAVIVDHKLNVSQDLRVDPEFSFASGAHGISKTLKILVGDAATISDQIPDGALPETFQLSQNFPNPFNPATTIRYGLPRAANVTIKVFDILGHEVRTLLNSAPRSAGFHLVTWEGRDRHEREVASGLYIYQIVSGDFTETRKMLLIK